MMKALWPSYGVMIPIYSGLNPALKKDDTTDSTFSVSFLFKKEVPEADISSFDTE